MECVNFFPPSEPQKSKHSPNQEKGSRSWHPPSSIYNTNSLLNNLTNASTGRDKKLFSECCWSYGASAQSPDAGNKTWTSLCLEFLFWLFLTKTKQDQTMPSCVHMKIWPRNTHLWLGFLGFSGSMKDTFVRDTL